MLAPLTAFDVKLPAEVCPAFLGKKATPSLLPATVAVVVRVPDDAVRVVVDGSVFATKQHALAMAICPSDEADEIDHGNTNVVTLS